MESSVHELRPKTGESEKITINLGYVDLGHVDLMVQQGFYSNRTDFIRTAIRNQLERHAGWSSKPWPATPWTSACAITLARTSRRYGTLAKPFPSMCSGWSASRAMSRPNWPARRSPRSRCWGHSTPARRSRPLWRIECGSQSRAHRSQRSRSAGLLEQHVTRNISPKTGSAPDASAVFRNEGS